MDVTIDVLSKLVWILGLVFSLTMFHQLKGSKSFQIGTSFVDFAA